MVGKMVKPGKSTFAKVGVEVKGVMAPVVVKNVMENAGAVVGRKFKKIDALPAEDRVLLMDLFYKGKSIPDIAATLQDMGHFKDVKPATLEQYLYKFKWEVVDKQALIRTEQMKEDSKLKLLDKVSQQYDVMEELASLIAVQKTRLEKVLLREKDMPMLFNSVGGEIKMLSGLLQQYGMMQFDLGYLRKSNLMKITDENGRVTTVESEGQASVVVGTEQRGKIEDAAKSFFELLGRRMLEKQVNENGRVMDHQQDVRQIGVEEEE